ncbi:AraC family transcriptional regulator, regulatory protein of adaptative response / DNA-3-methyladenine glycosylase II [Vibrio crassostreae]|uniref:AlkA N-terminal domain-containing protein n=1 Tax=Vibrio crassostreae TaxID=246167 RepID=UPI001B30086A|nr:AlkA N-terminal domain-containing protein [Vibrio crassostreae]CAK1702150.1 AraC family transcriptional regulator, regulatory protein of adaptative response / DNA-3-methyladenine glycosylase II [Vibrio crassostreae]CAK1702407.1 AraC family transcriptional regulator, regulatory protein of adaptative response / DNA-3-methyladenine glycosylase II [Vibrio crassostreae]CAK1883031.1 AraC family transcriptional regulator, regulatory protein of adaptative response / DNA-3-methyladenine glycosylase II
MSKNIHHNSTLTSEQCHLARYARDARFDGMFFTAVKTTGIFCRPICPASPPKEENVEYFSHQAQALKAGYRPCLRCRPDSAPFSPAWKGVETTFLRAMQLIDNGALNSGSIVDLATRLGISDRYLRTLFDNYIGVSPKQYSLYSQLMFAKQLLHTSSMSITDVGFASGFNSTRRFNDAFQKELQLSPSQIRRAKLSDSVSNHIQLGFHGPLDWKHLLAFYRRRMIEGLEEVGEDYYQRTVNVNGSKGWFQATLAKDNRLDIEFELDDISHLRSLIANIRRMFDLDVDIAKVEAFFETIDPNLVAKSGIRIPGVWNPWEAGVRAILGQQVSVTAAIGQLNLLVKELSDTSEKAYFPTPKQIAEADVSFLRMPGSRKETLKRFAEYMVDNETEHPSKWIELKGIGPWTIQYALLRGLSEPNHLLVGDLVVKKFIEYRPAINTESVSPWGSYATFHCWNQS